MPSTAELEVKPYEAIKLPETAAPEPQTVQPLPSPQAPPLGFGKNKLGGIAFMADSILKGYMQGKEKAEQKKAIQTKRMSDALQFDYNAKAQQYRNKVLEIGKTPEELAKEKADLSGQKTVGAGTAGGAPTGQPGVVGGMSVSPENQSRIKEIDGQLGELGPLRQQVDASYSNMMEFYSNQINGPKKKGKGKQQDQSNPLASVMSGDPNEKLQGWLRIGMSSGAPVHYQISQDLTQKKETAAVPQQKREEGEKDISYQITQAQKAEGVTPESERGKQIDQQVRGILPPKQAEDKRNEPEKAADPIVQQMAADPKFQPSAHQMELLRMAGYVKDEKATTFHDAKRGLILSLQPDGTWKKTQYASPDAKGEGGDDVAAFAGQVASRNMQLTGVPIKERGKVLKYLGENGIPLPPQMSTAAEDKLSQRQAALDSTLDIMARIEPDLDLLKKVGNASLVQMSESPGMVSRLAGWMTSDKDKTRIERLAGNIRSLHESLNILRAPLGATGFRGSEGWKAIQEQGILALTDPNVNEDTFKNTVGTLTKLKDATDKILDGSQGEQIDVISPEGVEGTAPASQWPVLKAKGFKKAGE